MYLTEEFKNALNKLSKTNKVEADLLFSIFDQVEKGSIELFNKLPPTAREWLRREIIEKAADTNFDKTAIEEMYALDYERIPPTPEVFFESDDYMGTPAKDMFPAWKPTVIRACNPNNKIFELILTGASGLGKTAVACYVLSYKLARLMCLRDAAAFYGLQARSKIYFGLYATTKKMMKEVGFYDLRDMLLDQSPFFRDVYPRLPHGNEYIRWEHKPVEVVVGSTALHAVGRSLFAVVADELNFYAQGEKTADRAHDLVAEVSRRLESRFVTESGDIPGIAIYISQTRTSTDFLERRIREKKNVAGLMVARGPRWAFNPLGYHRERNRGFRPDLGDPFFRVYMGTDTTDPKILDSVVYRLDGTPHIASLNPDEDDKVETNLVLKVPLTHYKAFRDDLHGALRNIGDVPSGAFTPFFPRKEIVENAFTRDIPYPFSSQIIPCYERVDTKLQDAFDYKAVTKIHMGKPMPIRNPESPRYIHFDLSISNDRTGFAMVHPTANYIEDRRIDGDASQVGEGESIKNIEVDFYLAITSGPYKEPIDFRKIRVFVDWLRRCGYWIKKISSDSFQSADHLQRLREMGFVAETMSVDRTSQPYRVLRQAMNEGRILLPYPRGVTDDNTHNILLYKELTGLEYDVQRDKIDHRADNSKDVADSIAGAIYSALSDDSDPIINPKKKSVPNTVSDNLNRYLDFI